MNENEKRIKEIRRRLGVALSGWGRIADTFPIKVGFYTRDGDPTPFDHHFIDAGGDEWPDWESDPRLLGYLALCANHYWPDIAYLLGEVERLENEQEER
jgi:hypothetical protein